MISCSILGMMILLVCPIINSLQRNVLPKWLKKMSEFRLTLEGKEKNLSVVVQNTCFSPEGSRILHLYPRWILKSAFLVAFFIILENFAFMWSVHVFTENNDLVDNYGDSIYCCCSISFVFLTVDYYKRNVIWETAQHIKWLLQCRIRKYGNTLC